MPNTSPEDMRTAMADYVRTVHRAYLSSAAGQPPAIRGRLDLLAAPFTVVAAAVRNLHVVATAEVISPAGPNEVAIDDELESLRWTVRFFDPSVLPSLGMIDDRGRGGPGAVRRALGLSTHHYHLVVQPGAQLTPHHAGHAGAGLAHDHLADARDYEAIRAHARGREALVDEMEGAARAGLPRALALLASQIAPDAPAVSELAVAPDPDPTALRKAVLSAVRSSTAPGGVRG